MRVRRIVVLALAVFLLPVAAPLRADTAVDALARDVARAESVRSVKTLQRLYAQYAQYGLWNEIGALFVQDGTFRFDGQITAGETVKGREQIATFLRSRYGGGHEGLLPGDVRTTMIEAPIVNLSADGQSAKARWYALIFTGDSAGEATIEGGTFQNEYVLENGVWKIASAHYYPRLYGPYEQGWTNWGGGDLPLVPYHFTPDTVGVPIPPPIGPAPAATETLAQLRERIARLNSEDDVRNLQAAYGYYADRKMWDDVVDLFAGDGVLEVAGAGVYHGPEGVRRWLETMGPAGLTHGQLNDRPQFDTIVTVAPGGNEAFARGIELGMLGEADDEKGWWEVAVFSNRFVREDGVWKIREMRRFPLFKTDYYQGWGKSRITDPVPTGNQTPDAAIPGADHSPVGLAMPAFLQLHPVTGQPVRPSGQAKLVAEKPITGAIAPSAPLSIAVEEARRRLALSTAWDGVENVSGAYTSYLDDYQSHHFGALIAEKGFKMSAFAGYYVGRERVTEAGVRVWGPPPTSRPGVHFHWRPQPIIMVAPDGKSANLHVRLFQIRTGNAPRETGSYAAAFMSGKYHDQFVLENGSWRFWNLSLDEPYMMTAGWKGGWAKAKDPTGPLPRSRSVLVREDSDFKPDVPVTALGKRQEHFWGGTGETWQWPTILPMWFEFTNPVTGRMPENYQENCAPCTAAPHLRLDRNGFMEPPDLRDSNRLP